METVCVLDVVRLQGLIAEYGRLRRLEGHTPQSRGQRLNEVVAEMLRCWGIEARTSIRSLGEIDVGFSVGGVRYVVEAKWEQAKTDTGHVAKLQKRVRQRFAGTCGVFLSMSGYSQEALADVAHGERLEVLLLDATHFEAMLAGLVPPQEILSLLHDRAAFYGEAHTPLSTLVASTVAPQVTFGAPNSLTAALMRSAQPGAAGEVLFSVPDSNQLGLAYLDPDRLLVTTQHGIMAVDLAKRSAGWAAPVSGCHRSPVVDSSGAVLFTRRTGVGRYHDGELTVIGGGFAGTTWLMPHPDGSTWVFGNGEPGTAVGAAVTRLGGRLGDEERMAHDYPAGSAMNGCWINGREVIAVGGSGLSVAVPGEPSRWLHLPQPNPMGLVRLTPTSVLTGGDALCLLCTDLGTGQNAEVARLNLSGPVNELAVTTDGSVYVAAYSQPADNRMPFVVAKVRTALDVNAGAVAPVVTPVSVTPPAAILADTMRQTAVAPATAPGPSGQRSATVHPPPVTGWQVSRRDRGNRQGEYVAFHGRSGIYWAIVGINVLLITVLAIVIAVPDTSIVAKVIVGMIEVFLVAVTIGFGKMASAPIRLEIGAQGIQVFARSDTSWFPWQVLDRVEVMRLEGGNLHLVAWCAGANMFPEFDRYGGGPRFLPRLGAVAVCPVNVLRARRHLIVRALHAYGGNRVGVL
jgi:Holliday junction resolvase-like predicted endonuclease